MTEIITPQTTQTETQHKYHLIRRVLVVDDEEQIRRLFARIFLTMNYEAVTCGSGEEAYDELARISQKAPYHYTFMLSDVKMVSNGMDGITLAKKAQELIPHLPVILLTGYTSTIKKEDLSSNVVKLVQKPISILNLEHLLQHTIEPLAVKADILLSNSTQQVN